VKVRGIVPKLSFGRIWSLVRRDVKRGVVASYHDYNTLARIDEWSWPFWGEKPHTVPVHVLAGAQDWRLAAWMLASFFHATEIAWPVVVHDDGTLPKEGRETIGRLFTAARIILREEADAALNLKLKAFPFCEEFRRMHPLALKIFDMAHFATGDRFLAFDSNVLFFAPPREIREWADGVKKECWFNEDAAEGSLISAAEAREELGVKLWSRVNTGLCLLWKLAIDFDFCDRALAGTSILRGHLWRVEQTLLALCASRHGKGGLLPKRYEVSLRRNAAEDAISRNYIGAVRDRFYGEGIKRLREKLLTDEED
jgi:hypothetical protein